MNKIIHQNNSSHIFWILLTSTAAYLLLQEGKTKTFASRLPEHQLIQTKDGQLIRWK